MLITKTAMNPTLEMFREIAFPYNGFFFYGHMKEK